IAAIADFNGDGKPDIVAENDSTRQVTVIYLGGAQGTTMLGWSWLAPSAVPGWTVVAARDLDGNGTPDLVWQNDATRQVSVWYMTGAQGNVFSGWSYLSASPVPGWSVIVR